MTQAIGEYIQNRYSSANSQVLAHQNMQNPCTSGLDEFASENGLKAIKAVDVLGREIPLESRNCIKIVSYENGSVKQLYEYE